MKIKYYRNRIISAFFCFVLCVGENFKWGWEKGLLLLFDVAFVHWVVVCPGVGAGVSLDC